MVVTRSSTPRKLPPRTLKISREVLGRVEPEIDEKEPEIEKGTEEKNKDDEKEITVETDEEISAGQIHYEDDECTENEEDENTIKPLFDEQLFEQLEVIETLKKKKNTLVDVVRSFKDWSKVTNFADEVEAAFMIALQYQGESAPDVYVQQRLTNGDFFKPKTVVHERVDASVSKKRKPTETQEVKDVRKSIKTVSMELSALKKKKTEMISQPYVVEDVVLDPYEKAFPDPSKAAIMKGFVNEIVIKHRDKLHFASIQQKGQNIVPAYGETREMAAYGETGDLALFVATDEGNALPSIRENLLSSRVSIKELQETMGNTLHKMEKYKVFSYLNNLAHDMAEVGKRSAVIRYGSLIILHQNLETQLEQFTAMINQKEELMFKRILQSALDGGSRDSLAPEEINYLRRMTARDKTITWKTLRVSTFVPLDIVNDRIALLAKLKQHLLASMPDDITTKKIFADQWPQFTFNALIGGAIKRLVDASDVPLEDLTSIAGLKQYYSVGKSSQEWVIDRIKLETGKTRGQSTIVEIRKEEEGFDNVLDAEERLI